MEGKKGGIVLDWGHAPFVYDEKVKPAFIPDGFKIETKSDGLIWIGTTRVVRGEVEYMFSLKNRQVSSGWHKNPSAAYREANELAENPKYKKSANGALIVGVTYPNVQSEIIKRFHDDLELQFEQDKRITKQAFDNQVAVASPPAANTMTTRKRLADAKTSNDFGFKEPFRSPEPKKLHCVKIEETPALETLCQQWVDVVAPVASYQQEQTFEKTVKPSTMAVATPKSNDDWFDLCDFAKITSVEDSSVEDRPDFDDLDFWNDDQLYSSLSMTYLL